MKNLLLSTCFITLLGFAFQLQAQQTVGISFVYNEALHQYSKNIEQDPAGIAITYLTKIPNKKFMVGGEIGVSMYANEDYTMELTEKGYPNAFADAAEEDCYFTYSVIGRYLVNEDGAFNLYMEGRAGGATFFTDRAYENIYAHDSGVKKPKTLENDFHFNSTTFQLSYGLGIVMDLNKFSKEKDFPVSLDFNFNHTLGAKAKYRNVSSDESVATRKNSVIYSSNTSSMAYRFGIYYSF